jgi:hypothetical protein
VDIVPADGTDAAGGFLNGDFGTSPFYWAAFTASCCLPVPLHLWRRDQRHKGAWKTKFAEVPAVARSERRGRFNCDCGRFGSATYRSLRHHPGLLPEAVSSRGVKEFAMPDNSMKQRADAQFRKLPSAEDGKTVMSETEAGAAAVATNTARLKELRLARDATERTAPPSVKGKKVRGKKKRPAASLSDWLKQRRIAGHSH